MPAIMNQTELLSGRAVIRLSGEDRLSFLQGVATQDVELLNSRPAVFSALLTPQGKILFDFLVVTDGDALLIDCNSDAAPALLKRLSLYKLRAKVALEIDANLSVGVIWGDPPSAMDSEGTIKFLDPRLQALGRRVIGPTAFVSALLQEYGDRADFNAHRIALGAPEFGADFASDEVFLTDVNYDALNGVSYKKGCFIGQEVTSRMKRKGDIRRRTLIAQFDGAAPENDASVTAGASTLGEISSSAAGRALAIIRLDRWEKATAEETPVECEGRSLRLRIPEYLARISGPDI